MGISQIKSSADTAHDVIYTTASDDITSTGTTDIVNVTEMGRLLAITLYVTASIGGGPNPNTDLEIVIDGGTTRSISVYNDLNTWDPSGVAVWAKGENTVHGEATADRLTITVGANYATSLIVRHNVSTASNTGSITFGVLRGTAL